MIDKTMKTFQKQFFPKQKKTTLSAIIESPTSHTITRLMTANPLESNNIIYISQTTSSKLLEYPSDCIQIRVCFGIDGPVINFMDGGLQKVQKAINITLYLCYFI